MGTMYTDKIEYEVRVFDIKFTRICFEKACGIAWQDLSTSVLKALADKFDIKRHSPRILYLIVLYVFI